MQPQNHLQAAGFALGRSSRRAQTLRKFPKIINATEDLNHPNRTKECQNYIVVVSRRETYIYLYGIVLK